MSFANDIAQISGLSFAAGQVYGMEVHTHASDTLVYIDGVPNYIGFVDIDYVVPGVTGTVYDTDPTTGTFRLSPDGRLFQLNGSSADGKFLFFHQPSAFASNQATFAISNSGLPPSGRIDYATSNNYESPNPVCFAEGVFIDTPDGEIRVEMLKAGDVVLTASGSKAAINWVGRRSIRCINSPWSDAVTPVEITSDAIADGVPNRPLVVSPNHGILMQCVDRFLVPAYTLVNGCTVVRRPVDKVVYRHIEIDPHDILLANGAGAESYLDVGNRGQFDGERGIVALVPERGSGERIGSVLPTISSGIVLSAIRARMLNRALALGWGRESFVTGLGISVETNKCSLAPLHGDGVVRFFVPPEVDRITIRCPTFVPAHFDAESQDYRELGLCLRSLTIDDGLNAPRRIDLDSEELRTGFHRCEEDQGGILRWTTGEAELPFRFWSGCSHGFFLRIEYCNRTIQTWQSRASATRALSLVG